MESYWATYKESIDHDVIEWRLGGSIFQENSEEKSVDHSYLHRQFA